MVKINLYELNLLLLRLITPVIVLLNIVGQYLTATNIHNDHRPLNHRLQFLLSETKY